jgi:peptide/nickel transport system permease protein
MLGEARVFGIIVLRRLFWIGLLVLAGGLITATLVRFSPGFGVEENELDNRLSSRSILAIQESHKSERSVVAFYVAFLAGLFHGDLGESHLFSCPISELLRQRWRVSVRSIVYGLSTAWLVVFVLASTVVMMRNSVLSTVVSGFAGALLAIPIAMVAFFGIIFGYGASFALMLAVSPPLFRYVRNILGASFCKSYIIAARATGIGVARIFWWHVLPSALPQLVGLVGVSISMAIGALIPIELLCDSPGVGQLALQAALARDLPLLVSLTGVVTIVVMLSNMIAEVSGELCLMRVA